MRRFGQGRHRQALQVAERNTQHVDDNNPQNNHEKGRDPAIELLIEYQLRRSGATTPGGPSDRLRSFYATLPADGAASYRVAKGHFDPRKVSY